MLIQQLECELHGAVVTRRYLIEVVGPRYKEVCTENNKGEQDELQNHSYGMLEHFNDLYFQKIKKKIKLKENQPLVVW